MPVPQYPADLFDKMVEETKPDTVIVCSVDCTHHQYIIRAAAVAQEVFGPKRLPGVLVVDRYHAYHGDQYNIVPRPCHQSDRLA